MNPIVHIYGQTEYACRWLLTAPPNAIPAASCEHVRLYTFTVAQSLSASLMFNVFFYMFSESGGESLFVA
jgi:hypothetical protein